MEGCWVFGGVEWLEPNSENPFQVSFHGCIIPEDFFNLNVHNAVQEERFDGEKGRLGNMFAVIVEKRDARTLIPLLRRFVRPGSIIVSDCWKAYDRIKEIREAGFYYYDHMTVNHSVCFKCPTTGADTNTCEGAWSSQYKRHIANQNYRKECLQGHLFERVWKRKYRSALWKNIWRVLSEQRYEYDGPVLKKPLR